MCDLPIDAAVVVVRWPGRRRAKGGRDDEDAWSREETRKGADCATRREHARAASAQRGIGPGAGTGGGGATAMGTVVVELSRGETAAQRGRRRRVPRQAGRPSLRQRTELPRRRAEDDDDSVVGDCGGDGDGGGGDGDERHRDGLVGGGVVWDDEHERRSIFYYIFPK
jgi:hypothetical protein